MATPSTDDILTENLQTVQGRIADACRRAGRAPDGVTLVAVTKTVDPGVIRALADLGVRHVGENRVQQLLDRADDLADLDLAWHMIGHLQRNKVRKVLPRVALVHSVDSLRLAEAIDRVAGEADGAADALLEVNVAGEAAKFGFTPADLDHAVESLGRLTHLRVRGLMTMAPFVDDAETVRPVFASLRDLAARLGRSAPPNVSMGELSMGMTQDYVQAVEEGATIVRVGTALFRGLPPPPAAAGG